MRDVTLEHMIQYAFFIEKCALNCIPNQGNVAETCGRLQWEKKDSFFDKQAFRR